MPTTPEGLKSKFMVYERRTGDPVGGCVVLKFDDPLAARALLTWARDVARVYNNETLLHEVADAIAGGERDDVSRPPTRHP